jgi:hypothetical protein
VRKSNPSDADSPRTDLLLARSYLRWTGHAWTRWSRRNRRAVAAGKSVRHPQAWCPRYPEARRELAFQGLADLLAERHRHTFVMTQRIRHLRPIENVPCSPQRFNAILCSVVIFAPRHCRYMGLDRPILASRAIARPPAIYSSDPQWPPGKTGLSLNALISNLLIRLNVTGTTSRISVYSGGRRESPSLPHTHSSTLAAPVSCLTLPIH